MTHEIAIEQPMEMVELKLNMIIDINPHLIIALDRSVSHPFISNYGCTPCSQYYIFHKLLKGKTSSKSLSFS